MSAQYPVPWIISGEGPFQVFAYNGKAVCQCPKKDAADEIVEAGNAAKDAKDYVKAAAY